MSALLTTKYIKTLDGSYYLKGYRCEGLLLLLDLSYSRGKIMSTNTRLAKNGKEFSFRWPHCKDISSFKMEGWPPKPKEEDLPF